MAPMTTTTITKVRGTTYRDDPAQTVQHFSFIATVEELLDLDAIERFGGTTRAAGGRGGIEGELSGWN